MWQLRKKATLLLEACFSFGQSDLDCEEIQFTNFKDDWPDSHHLDTGDSGIGCER